VDDKTAEAIRRVICKRLLAWHSGSPSQTQPEAIPLLRSVVDTQDAPGLDPQTFTTAWDHWDHRNSILHEQDFTKQHKLIMQDSDRLISRQFAMGVVQGLPSKDHYLLHLLQKPMEELLKAPLHAHEQWLASAQSEQAEKYPEERQVMANWLLQGKLGNTQHLVFSIVTSLSTMRRSSLYVQTYGVVGDFKAFVALVKNYSVVIFVLEI
jgi:hypothetical protein